MRSINKIWVGVGAGIVLVGGLYWIGSTVRQHRLEAAELKCEQAAVKWRDRKENSSAKWGYINSLNDVHFSSGLNTCLIEYEHVGFGVNDDIHPATDQKVVADLYNNTRKILELDVDNKIINQDINKGASSTRGILLFENGKEVSASDSSLEYQKRKAVLFEQYFSGYY